MSASLSPRSSLKSRSLMCCCHNWNESLTALFTWQQDKNFFHLEGRLPKYSPLVCPEFELGRNICKSSKSPHFSCSYSIVILGEHICKKSLKSKTDEATDGQIGWNEREISGASTGQLTKSEEKQEMGDQCM